MKEIVSRFTMVNKGCAFIDMVSGREVFLYEDKYGVEWLAYFPFFPWSDRMERYG